MKFWMTTHWPHVRSTDPHTPQNGVWVADDKREVIGPMAVGDLVWIYESQSGRSIIKEKADGQRVTIGSHPGRGGMVSLAEVTVEPSEDSDSEPEHYVGGSTIWWRWYADTKTVNSAGFLPREQVNELLGYKPNNSLRGFGTKHSGLMEVTEDLHLRLLRAFLASHRDEDERRLQRSSSQPRGGEGGEGEIHKRLKMAVASDPEGMLGESGLELVQLEYPFVATGDRIDVLLKDRLGRFVAVEVEPSCPLNHRSGPLQCVKYRALISYDFDRHLQEVRTFLVSHELDDAVQKKAEKFGIECVEVPAWDDHPANSGPPAPAAAAAFVPTGRDQAESPER